MAKSSNGWDERYRHQENLNGEPVPLLVSVAEHLMPGRALDLASGTGRHSAYLARLGWQVTAVDYSQVAIEILRRRAEENNLLIDARAADLESGEFSIAPDAYDLICDFFYLQRSLFPQIREGVRPGGLFLAQIHMIDHTPGVRLMREEHLLQGGELHAQFAGWKILYYSERRPEDGHRRRTAEIVARKA